MLSKLPLELQVRLLRSDPTSCLKHTNSHFYILYNDLFFDKIVSTFGESIIDIIKRVLPWLKSYIKSLDVFRYDSRNIIASRLKLVDVLPSHLHPDNDDPNSNNPLHSIYVKDSWKYIYSVLKNKRLFAEYADYKIDQPSNYVFNHFVEINRTYLLSYAKFLWLPPGVYNLNVGLVVKHGSGLGTTKFEVKYTNEDGTVVPQTIYPPSNINDILPKQQFCLLKIGEFVLPNKKDATDKLHKVELTMEEIGLYLKSGFRIFFIDIAQPSLLFNEFDLLFYTINETNFKYFIHMPLKNFYKALNAIQSGESGDHQDEASSTIEYGIGDPMHSPEQYDWEYIDQKYITYTPKQGDQKNTDNELSENDLMTYSNHYFNASSLKRSFKFNTIYQRRQFINRFGDFDLDWRTNDTQNAKNSSQNDQKSCLYDSQGLKWKIPILGEL